MKRLQKPLIPRYSIAPGIITLLIFSVTYYPVMLLTQGRTHFSLELPIDRWIPLWTPSAVIYFLAYFQWFLAFLFILRQEKQTVYRLLSSEWLPKLVAVVIFIVFPTQFIGRQSIEGTGIFDRFLALIWSCDDPPVNLFPSLHCLESWFSFRAISQCRGVPKWFNIVHLLFSILVFASTVLTKQHFIIDVPAGILLCELGFLLTKKWYPAKLYDLFLKNGAN